MSGSAGVFQVRTASGIRWWSIASWEEAGITAGFCGADVDLRAGAADWERAFLPEADGRRLLLLKQVHETAIVEVPPVPTPGDGDDVPTGDAWLVDLRDCPSRRFAYGIKTADCAPIVVFAKQAGLIAGVHCGWRGAVGGLLTLVIERMRERGAAADDLQLAIGPAARACCYEVGPEVVRAVESAAEAIGANAGSLVLTSRGRLAPAGDSAVEACSDAYGGSHFHCDIPGLLAAQAEAAGVPATQIYVLERCTICDDLFFSHRRQKGDAGRQVTFFTAAMHFDFSK